MGTANRWTSQNGQQEGRNLNVNDKYTIRRGKKRKKLSHQKREMRNTHQPPPTNSVKVNRYVSIPPQQYDWTEM